MSEADSGRTRHSDNRETWVERLVTTDDQIQHRCNPYKAHKAGHLQQALQADDTSPKYVVVDREARMRSTSQ
ncbi:uncharacterized protein EAF02_006540 [Botrytis sinoallii]|uniref:uncharacterized protein n=1 Tax=Botrytis sinoallii TaxID=1463999 RepID=UPI0019004329|nr:uncharacterized protein EAF02_006540 [Botrytis sinoallii]KAF7881852.1 hypothetical protein EAF02_006540 [Botrytis sinoallii]